MLEPMLYCTSHSLPHHSFYPLAHLPCSRFHSFPLFLKGNASLP